MAIQKARTEKKLTQKQLAQVSVSVRHSPPLTRPLRPLFRSVRAVDLRKADGDQRLRGWLCHSRACHHLEVGARTGRPFAPWQKVTIPFAITPVHPVSSCYSLLSIARALCLLCHSRSCALGGCVGFVSVHPLPSLPS